MKRIFVLEDDKGWEAYYRRALKKYDLAFFNNGIEAIAAMDDERPDLVILDVLLAGPTGFAVVHEMRSYPELENVPIIVVSSVKIGEIDEKYGISKTFDKAEMMPRDLLNSVANALGVA
jgi:DNA-binding response OmpR family regulator